MKALHIIIALALNASCVLFAAESPVYPVPQSLKLKKETTRVEKVVVKKRQQKSNGGLWKELPADKDGGYAVAITPGKLEVYANDDDGVFYAKQTISQLLTKDPAARGAHKDPYSGKSLDKVATQDSLPMGTIIDWPDLPYRGVVEGYYGTPWSYEARCELFDFMGRNKMNTYLYAPKDDPYHHGAGCYKPYPKDKADDLRKLVQRAHQNHVRFVWAIHPANTVRWAQNGGKEQLEALCVKLQQLYDLGVRDFGVLVDDSSGEIGKPERQAELCNYIFRNFVQKHKDVTQKLIMCPTGYNRSWTNANFLTTLGNALDENIYIMWTGDTVVHDITLEGQKWVNALVKRPTFIWWNWPCSDFKRSNLSMGRCYGNSTSPEMKEQMSGFVANPMEQAEANKVGLFGVADYTWNITAFDSDTAWKAGVKRLYPTNSEAMQVFCDHNSYLLPNGHGYYREEAVNIRPKADEYLQSVSKGKPSEAAAEVLKEEFVRMAKAGAQLSSSKAPEIKTLQAEIAPWFTQFTLTGKAGVCVMKALQKMKNRDVALSRFFETLDYMDTMKTITRMEWNGGKPKPMPDVRVASLSMTPALEKTFDFVNRSLYADLAGVKLSSPTFTASRGDTEKNRDALEDDNLRTFWEGSYHQAVGDWYCLDFGSPVEMRRINLLMGGPRANDYVPAGQFEVSDDGSTWKPLGDECNGPAAVLNLADKPVKARMVRFRVTQARRNWLTICEFSVNRTVPPYVTNTLASRPNLQASKSKDAVSVNRVMEVFPIRPGESISLETPAHVRPSSIEINLENQSMQKWAKIELTTSEGEVIPVQGTVQNGRLYVDKGLPQQAVTALRLTNVGNDTEEIKVTQFRIGIPEGGAVASADTLTDGDLSTRIKCDSSAIDMMLKIPARAKEMIVVGTANCTVEGAEQSQKSEFITRYTLRGDKKMKTLRLKAPKQADKFISEVIFK